MSDRREFLKKTGIAAGAIAATSALRRAEAAASVLAPPRAAASAAPMDAATKELLMEALNAAKKDVNGSRILVLGMAYKPNVDDDRESPSYVLMDLFKARGAEMGYFDPYVPVIKLTREHPHWAGSKSMAWNKASVSSFDAVVIATNHKDVDYDELAKWAPCIIDTRNAMNGIATKPGQVWKA